MKTIRNILLSGAVLAVAAQAGQSFNVNFPFRTTTGDLPAGKYVAEVRQLATTQYLQLRNMETGAAVMITPTNPVTNIRGTEKPRLEFTCGAAGCDLKRLWRDGVSGLDFRQRKMTPAEKERLSAVRTETVAAE